MSRRVLITGASGYIGSRLSLYLSNVGDVQLILATRRDRHCFPWIAGAKVIRVDWKERASIERLCENITDIVHLASMNEIDAEGNIVGAFEATTFATARLVEVAKRMGVARFIYLSTAHVYGAHLIGRVDENTCPRPLHPYGISHRAAEDIVIHAHLMNDFVGMVFRVSNGYGYPVHAGIKRWTLLVNDLCRQAVMRGRLELRSSGLQYRDFVTITDVCRAVWFAMNLPKTKVGDGIFNLGGGRSETVLQMAKHVAKRCEHVLGISPEIIRREEGNEEGGSLLDYRIDKLRSVGFNLGGDRDQEIDMTLMACRKYFG